MQTCNSVTLQLQPPPPPQSTFFRGRLAGVVHAAIVRQSRGSAGGEQVRQHSRCVSAAALARNVRWASFVRCSRRRRAADELNRLPRSRCAQRGETVAQRARKLSAAMLGRRWEFCRIPGGGGSVGSSQLSGARRLLSGSWRRRREACVAWRGFIVARQASWRRCRDRTSFVCRGGGGGECGSCNATRRCGSRATVKCRRASERAKHK